MVALYFRMIREGVITIDDVPKKWRSKVRAQLDEDATTSED